VILVYGRTDDAPLARTLEALQERGAPCVLLAQEALAHEGLRLELGADGIDGALTVGGQALPLESITAVYARPLELPTQAFDPAGALRARLLHERLYEWLEVAAARVVNRPSAMQSNASKPLQAQWIGAAGFAVPATLVSSDPDEVRAFWRRHGRVVFKSISGIRSIVRELDEPAAARLDRLAALPAQFQAWIPGTDVRVHVVGTRCFAAEIESSSIDYRYAQREGGTTVLRPWELPDSVARRCVALAQAMGLALAGIDLRRRPDGECVCFEVNPMPAYTFFAAAAEQPIAEALAELLAAGEKSAQDPSRTAERTESWCSPSRT
jgi:ribosomal protein S6-L-glutamate ligase RimK-like protein